MDPVLTSNQHFILQLVTISLGTIGTIVTGILAYLTLKVKNKQEQNMNETRDNMGQLARAVNGKVHETIAQVKAASILEGAKLESERANSLDAEKYATQRIQQVVTEANEASKNASVIASDAATKIFEVPGKK
jgi:hypothetical protein